MTENPKLDVVRKLLAKAERASTPEVPTTAAEPLPTTQAPRRPGRSFRRRDPSLRPVSAQAESAMRPPAIALERWPVS